MSFFPAETDVLIPVLSQSTDVVVVNFVVVLKFPNNNVSNTEKELYLFIYKDSSDKVISSLVIKIICKQLWNLRSNSKMDFFEQQIIIILVR